MRLVIRLDMGNAAFVDNGISGELAQVLGPRTLGKIEAAARTSIKVREDVILADTNGNRIGTCKVIGAVRRADEA